MQYAVDSTECACVCVTDQTTDGRAANSRCSAVDQFHTAVSY